METFPVQIGWKARTQSGQPNTDRHTIGQSRVSNPPDMHARARKAEKWREDANPIQKGLSITPAFL